MKKIYQVLIFTFVLCFIAMIIIAIVQSKGQSAVENIRCSYFDPATIDILAFFAALFLVVEGFVRIFEHKNASIKRQFTRTLRIMFGCTILIIHIMQFLHK